MPTATNIPLTSILKLAAWRFVTTLDPGHLAARAALISPQHSMGSARPGTSIPRPSPASLSMAPATSASSIYGNAANVDDDGGISVRPYHLVDGFILNNQLSDFLSAEPRY